MWKEYAGRHIIMELAVSRDDVLGYYALLGVPPSASRTQIIDAFRLHARSTVDDLTRKKLEQAYHVLQDRTLRADYDSAAQATRQTSQPNADETVPPRSRGKAESNASRDDVLDRFDSLFRNWSRKRGPESYWRGTERPGDLWSGQGRNFGRMVRGQWLQRVSRGNNLLKFGVATALFIGILLSSPLVSENTSSYCHALEMQFSEKLRLEASVGVAKIITGDPNADLKAWKSASDTESLRDYALTLYLFGAITQGRLTEKRVREQYNFLPPAVACATLYWQAVVNIDWPLRRAPAP